jgi:hypothetical protein
VAQRRRGALQRHLRQEVLPRRTVQLTDRTRRPLRYDAFETFHNATHRYSALKGATPDQIEARAGFTPRPPTFGSDIPTDFTGLSGRVEWIRLIRSDAQLRILDHRFTMPDELIYEYVTATLIVEAHELVVTHQQHEITRHPFPLG